jgi:hypothetical protein
MKEEGLNQESDGMSMREFIVLLRIYLREVIRHWWVFLLFMVPLVVWRVYQVSRNPVTYTAKLTFMLNEDSSPVGLSSVLGSVSGLLGGGKDYQLEKILEIARSRRVVAATLFEKIEMNGKEDYFANHIIRVQGLHKRWEKSAELNGFVFKHDSIEQFNRTENTALKALHGEVVGGEGVPMPIFSSSVNDDTGILTLSSKTNDEALSIDFLNVLYENISDFYINKSVERERSTLDLLAEKRDSIARALNRNDYADAQFQDRNRALLLQESKVPAKRYQRNSQLLALMYGEAVKNAEFAEFALKNKMPFITPIDMPIPPLQPDPRGRGKAAIIAAVLGFGIALSIVMGRKLYRDAMAGS